RRTTGGDFVDVTEEAWESLRQAWESYGAVVGAWLALSASADTDPELLDGITHHLISEHQGWGEKLSAMLHATHHH
ncbi:MAG: hypothetical protein ACRDJK_12495, partial [Actinomycetota bacterium]